MSLFSGMSADKSADASADALCIIILYQNWDFFVIFSHTHTHTLEIFSKILLFLRLTLDRMALQLVEWIQFVIKDWRAGASLIICIFSDVIGDELLLFSLGPSWAIFQILILQIQILLPAKLANQALQRQFLP